MGKEKKTVVLGVSEKPDRYANKAVKKLLQAEIPVVAVGYKAGEIGKTPIQTDFPKNEDIHTVTLYLSKKNQLDYYEDIVDLSPQRVIFNPGTYNEDLEELLKENNIPFEHACTLVLLSSNNY